MIFQQKKQGGYLIRASCLFLLFLLRDYASVCGYALRSTCELGSNAAWRRKWEKIGKANKSKFSLRKFRKYFQLGHKRVCGTIIKKWTFQRQDWNTHFFGVGTHRICLLFSHIILSLCCASLWIPFPYFNHWWKVIPQELLSISGFRNSAELRSPQKFLFSPLFFSEKMSVVKWRGVLWWHKKGIGWIMVIWQPVQAGRNCVCLTNWTYIWRTGRSTMFIAFLRRKSGWARCWMRSLWKNSIGRHESRQIAQWNLWRCGGIIES